MAEKENTEKDAAPAGPKLIMGMSVPTFAFVVLNVLVCVGATGFIVKASLFYKKPAITEVQVSNEVTKAEKKKPAEASDSVFPINYSEMTITLRGQQGGKSHFATIEATIVCGSESCKSQVEANKARVEDIIQSALAARSYTELGTLETKFRVKHEILNKVNTFLKDTAAVDMLFTSFLVQ
jgi:flagellar basal body-associated protein FliL